MDADHGGLHRPILLGGDYLLDREFNRQHRSLSGVGAGELVMTIRNGWQRHTNDAKWV